MKTSLFDAHFDTTAEPRMAGWSGLHGSSLALALIHAARRHAGLALVVCRSNHQAQLLERDLELLNDGEVEVCCFPDRETLPFDPFSAHPEIAAARLAALARIATMTRGLVLVAAPGLLERLPPRPFVLGQSFDLVTGQRLAIDVFRAQLLRAGYSAADPVFQAGQFAVRGSVIDLFPSGLAQPLRLDLFDEEIESIRPFDPDTQRSSGRVDGFSMLPAREYPSDGEAFERFRKAFRYRFAVDMRKVAIYQDLRSGAHPQGLEQYLPLFYETTDNLLDYLAEQPVLLMQAGADQALERFWSQAEQRWEQRRHDVERPILEPGELLFEPPPLRQRLAALPCIHLAEPATESEGHIFFDTRPAPDLRIHERGRKPAGTLHAFLGEFAGRVMFAADTPGRREVLADTLAAFGLHPERHERWSEFHTARERLGLCVLPVNEGFVAGDTLAIVTESQLFGGRARPRAERAAAERDPEAIIRSLADLAEGAPVVHEDHGIGRYRGLETLEIDGYPAEFLLLEYAAGDRLYVPVSTLHRVSRYTGSDPEQAPLHRLGGDQWARARKRAARQVRDVAAELLDLYARRQGRPGHAFEVDPGLYAEFSAGFPYEETPDQQRAIEAVQADLEAGRPMDRLVCGDVGFGKTEVALRAAFMAVQGGRQVALLVPTTLLAQQHHSTFCDRFADWPVHIELLSRFRTGGQVDSVLKALHEGRVDIVIGTHRLIQKDVRFARLGLVIVDEEQRFGVRQKERLKELRAEVDFLTLTATPIPRTLNMAMSGIRDLSIIATPPARRMAVKTIITPWDRGTLREGLQRELQRGGQVFFLHNEVRSIERIAGEAEKLVPGARVRIAHGQMRERELEQVMLDFYRQRFNILVCTTIIENGIDVPTANTIVVNRADRFGLAQLHQLRGRVGRSHHRAYAYLVVPEPRAMTADARKRLEAIASLEELGAGFTLATHDLEIRGAGELLGEAQSGQIQAIGYSMYSELLARAVKALQQGEEPQLEGALHHAVDIELHLPALIPEAYLADVHARLTLYKRIASAASETDLRDLQVEMIDRFGLLPDAVRNLFEVAALRLAADRLGITRLDLGEHGGHVSFQERAAVEPESLLALIRETPERYRMSGPQRMNIRAGASSALARLEMASRLLQRLARPPSQ
ncbi:MAG: transcription-repair coupling factor [Xanthomonadales bacterium]|nr:transcription-repair coupling factor [Xanthomonadales bacterium]NIN59860.1 transcription-repair coupling factor [Xanthomonadales bacterium]NIN75234.1 transcription-repair coupling factor [Xanthomonadales bacterium]NIO13476.1 transcription-repair coupling factor [Xanthomonadales bacterium]NIP12253.1 transcription-repair coupling factor [Xanthomonadales bacterium]